MSRRLLLIECVERRRLPGLPWALLASTLKDLPHDRIQVHEFALSHLTDSGAGSGRVLEDPPALVFLDPSFPVREAVAFVEAVAPLPVVFYGPYALDRFEQVPARAAMIGPSREEVLELGTFALQGPGHPTETEFRSVDRLAVRATGAEGDSLSFRSGGTWPDAESLLDPFSPIFDWEYLGPRRRQDADAVDRAELWWPARVAGAPSVPEREAARLPVARSAEELPPQRIDRRWDAASHEPLRRLLERDASGSLFDLEGSSRSSATSLLADQARTLSRAGHRSLAVSVADPTPLLLPWLRDLARTEDSPVELLLSPTVHTLRRCEGIRQEILGAAQLTERLYLTGVDFAAFDDLSLRKRGLLETHWDQRWVARLLAEVDGSFDGRVTSTEHHRLSLFDPWTDPRELLESLVAIEDDAPFLKSQVHPGSMLSVPSRHSRLGRRIEAAGLLTQGPTGSGWGFTFVNPQMSTFLGLAQQGLGPLVEGIGRLRLAPRARQRAIVEARFRWIRQLAELFVNEPEGGKTSWGKVLASVTREVAVDLRRN